MFPSVESKGTDKKEKTNRTFIFHNFIFTGGETHTSAAIRASPTVKTQTWRLLLGGGD